MNTVMNTTGNTLGERQSDHDHTIRLVSPYQLICLGIMNTNTGTAMLSYNDIIHECASRLAYLMIITTDDVRVLAPLIVMRDVVVFTLQPAGFSR